MNEKNAEKILIGPSSFADLDPQPMERLKSEGYEVIDNPFRRRLTKTELLELLGRGITGLIAGLEPLDREVLTASQLKVVSRCGSGMSNVDQSAAAELGIEVRNTPDGPTSAVAELTVGAMLSLLRMIPEMDRGMHSGEWPKRIGLQLEGKTVAIIGMGRIGRRVAELLKPFRANIIAVDVCPDHLIENVTFCSMEEALLQADILTLHCSGEHCILGERELQQVKEGAYVLNAARGGLIDEEALAAALSNGKIDGVWLDTFSKEPYTGPLTKYSQVILTPHVGSYTRECRLNMEMESVENLIKVMNEKKEPS